MPRRPKRIREAAAARRRQLNINQVVAYNLRVAREMRDMTQEQLAKELTELLGRRVTQSTVSSLERAWDGDRRREFDVHEIAGFAIALDLPMLWFLLPPPGDDSELETYHYHVPDLYLLALGNNKQLEPLYDRLRQLGRGDPEPVEITVEKVTGKPRAERLDSYRHRRTELILARLDKDVDRLDEAAKELGSFFDHLRQVGIRGLIAENANDSIFSTRPQHRTYRLEAAAGGDASDEDESESSPTSAETV